MGADSHKHSKYYLAVFLHRWVSPATKMWQDYGSRPANQTPAWALVCPSVPPCKLPKRTITELCGGCLVISHALCPSFNVSQQGNLILQAGNEITGPNVWRLWKEAGHLGWVRDTATSTLTLPWQRAHPWELLHWSKKCCSSSACMLHPILGPLSMHELCLHQDLPWTREFCITSAKQAVQISLCYISNDAGTRTHPTLFPGICQNINDGGIMHQKQGCGSLVARTPEC